MKFAMEVDDCERFKDLCTISLQHFKGNNNFKLVPKIFSKIRDFSSNKTFREAVFHHAKILQDILPKLKQKENFSDLKFVSVEECFAFHLSKFFLEKINLFSTIVARPFLEDFEEPIESIQIEAFLRPNKSELSKVNFIKSLKKNDILYAEVTNSGINRNNGDVTQLQIISKVESNPCIIYHLNIFAYTFRKLECERLKIDDFKAFEVLKVSVLGKCISQDEEKVFVTTNSNVLQKEKGSLLGIISSQDLPFNLNLFKTAKASLSYTNFLRNHPNFYHSNLKEVIRSVGIEPYRIYSFSEKRDGYSLKTSECYKALLEKANPVETIEHKKSQIYLDEAKMLADQKDITNALSSFDAALKIWPKNFQVFECRGKMYFEIAQGDKDMFLKACLDFETALKLNPSSSLSKTYMEKILIRLSKREIKKKHFKEAKSYLTKALKLNKNSLEADDLLKRLVAKMKKIRRKEEKELMRLEKAKERLVQKLIKTES